ncbi:alpha/beta hydrolase [Sphingobacterium sp. MYb388]|uniref:alpha/beta hydrolase n=1 Tax=Sphingobacterium sp. MYb388 TaxID=2745437 RepID=UPI0030B7EE4C
MKNIKIRSLGICMMLLGTFPMAEAQTKTGTKKVTNTSDVRSTTTTMERVTFPNRDITIVGNLYLPKDFDKNKKYHAIVVGHPNGGVKEQTAGLYAQKLAEKGFVTLAFDASYQGESGGEPRFLDDPEVRTEDFRAAADYITIQDYIDPEKVGLLGICAGGGYVIHAAQTEHRYKAIATISMVDGGDLRRNGMNGSLTSSIQQRLNEVGKQRTIEANGGEIKYSNYVANTKDDLPANANKMYIEGYEYYRVTHKQESAPNKYLFTSLDKLINFTALDHVELISPRPLLLIAGSVADSYYFSERAYNLAKEPKELYKIEGATHIDLYWKQEYVAPIVEKLTDFYGNNL